MFHISIELNTEFIKTTSMSTIANREVGLSVEVTRIWVSLLLKKLKIICIIYGNSAMELISTIYYKWKELIRIVLKQQSMNNKNTIYSYFSKKIYFLNLTFQGKIQS